MLTGENGILTQAQRAKNETDEAQVEEQNILTGYEQIINASTGVNLRTITGYETSNTIAQDSLGNRVVVPAGFRVVNPEDNVEDGIIIEDVAHGETVGSQFIWIPVGTDVKKKDDTTFDIMLGRYVYKEDGTIDMSLSQTEPGAKLKRISTDLNYYIEGLKDSITANTHAKDIVTFISKVKSSGGYYIARYEGRTTTQRTASTEDNGLTQVTVKPNDYVYNFITQSQAARLSREMYDDTNFTSDLMNSYAWDTAIDFLQKCDDREENNVLPYSRQSSLNGSLAPQGTNNLDTKDVICNVYDMASNCYEHTTETYSYNVDPCVRRGGNIYSNNCYTAWSR